MNIKNLSVVFRKDKDKNHNGIYAVFPYVKESKTGEMLVCVLYPEVFHTTTSLTEYNKITMPCTAEEANKALKTLESLGYEKLSVLNSIGAKTEAPKATPKTKAPAKEQDPRKLPLLVELDRYTPERLKQYVQNGKFVVRFPEKVNDNFFCIGLGLNSLEGCPKEVSKHFYCRDNNLTSLKGCPQKVGRDFICSYNKLTSLDGAPKYVGGRFDCKKNAVKFTIDDLPEDTVISLRGEFCGDGGFFHRCTEGREVRKLQQKEANK